MSQSTISGKSIIQGLSRKEFHKKFIKGACQKPSFGALASFGAKNLSTEERIEICDILAKNGIPHNLTESNRDLDEIIQAISDRAISLC